MLKLFQREKFGDDAQGISPIGDLLSRNQASDRLWKDTLKQAKQNQAVSRVYFVMGIRRIDLNENFQTFDGKELNFTNWSPEYPRNFTQG